MTRVNVDDVAFMDRRFKLLGGRLGITWQEALGRCLPVWALAYARRSAVLPAGDVDALAERQGFAVAMLDVDLAAEDEGGVFLRGVADRIDFLLIQDAKRAKAREAKLAAAGAVAPRRPSRGTTATRRPDPPGSSPGTIPEEGPYSPDLDLDLDLDLDPEDQISLPPARDPAVPEPQPTTPPPAPSVPAVSPPASDREDIARTEPSSPPAIGAIAVARTQLAAEMADREPSREVEKPATPPPYNPADPRARGRLAELTWQRVSDARLAVAVELKLPAPLPLGEITPAARPRGFDELSTRIREAGPLAPEVCDRVVANLVKQARAKRSIDWLSERAFGDKAWPNARDGIDPSARSAAGRGDQRATQPSMPTPPKFAREVERRRAPEEIAELAAMARHAAAVTDGRSAADLPTAELVKRFGDPDARAGPGSASPTSSDPDDTPDDQPRRRKASA